MGLEPLSSGLCVSDGHFSKSFIYLVFYFSLQASLSHNHDTYSLGQPLSVLPSSHPVGAVFPSLPASHYSNPLFPSPGSQKWWGGPPIPLGLSRELPKLGRWRRRGPRITGPQPHTPRARAQTKTFHSSRPLRLSVGKGGGETRVPLAPSHVEKKKKKRTKAAGARAGAKNSKPERGGYVLSRRRRRGPTGDFVLRGETQGRCR